VLLRFEFGRMPHTSEMWNLSRGFEDLYYGLLFAEAYPAAEGVWRSWVAMGLDLGIREAPPGALPSDRIKIVTRSAGKVVELTIDRGRDDVKDRVWDIVRDLVGCVAEIKSLPGPERAARLRQGGPAGGAVVTVTSAMANGDVLEREAGVLVEALNRDIAAFSYPGLLTVTRDPQ